MSDYLEIEFYLGDDENALLTVHPVIGDQFIIPRVTGNPVRYRGAWHIPCERNNKPSNAVIPADNVLYFTVNEYAADDLGDDLTIVILENSDERLHVHGSSDCFGEVCSIHNRTDHSMRHCPQHWRSDRGIIERICDHGVGHPDPDDHSVMLGVDSGSHGCDGCCANPPVATEKAHA